MIYFKDFSQKTPPIIERHRLCLGNSSSSKLGWGGFLREIFEIDHISFIYLTDLCHFLQWMGLFICPIIERHRLCLGNSSSSKLGKTLALAAIHVIP
jgi:hypothetical protein